MKRFFTFAILAVFAVPAFCADQIAISPMSDKVVESMKQGVPAGDWKAPENVLKYGDLKTQAAEAEKQGKTAEALTLYERILDRSTTTETNRSETRTHIKELRSKVQAVNTDPAKAKKWQVLAVIYKNVDCDVIVGEGKTEHAKKSMNDGDFQRIGSELGGFRDLVFQWSSGLVVPEFEILYVEEPLGGKHKKGDFPVGISEISGQYREGCKKFNKKFDTVIGFAKCGGDEGPGFGVPFAAAIYGRLRQLDKAGYMMVPWAPNYPFTNRGELSGEMELHEWLHQIDDVVSQVLGYPSGTTRSPDDGRTVNDSRKDGEQEYKRSPQEKTWTNFYKHIMQEHMTRQIWSELTIDNIPDEKKPGKKILIEKE